MHPEHYNINNPATKIMHLFAAIQFYLSQGHLSGMQLSLKMYIMLYQ
jgi:hypothetical protein